MSAEGNDYANAIPPSSPPISPSLLTIYKPPMWDSFASWMNGQNHSGCNEGGHRHLEDRIPPPEGTLTPGTEGMAPEIVTPSLIPCRNSTTNTFQLPSSSPFLSVRYHPGEVMTAPIIVPGCEWQRPTPPTIYAESSSAREQVTAFGRRAIASGRMMSPCNLNNDSREQKVATTAENVRRQVALRILQSCRVSLEFHRVQKIIEAEAHLLSQNTDSMLSPLFNYSDGRDYLGLPTLGLPVQWKGIRAAVDYLRVLDTDEKTPFLSPIGRRIGQVLLYFNYEELRKHPGEYCSPCPSKRRATEILNSILNAYHDDVRISMPPQCRRNRITGYHVRRGRWWWRLAGSLGAGILLIADSQLMSVMYVLPREPLCGLTHRDDLGAIIHLRVLRSMFSSHLFRRRGRVPSAPSRHSKTWSKS